MIIVSSSLVLSPTPGVDADAPIIGHHNLVAFSTIVAGTEQAQFPATNLANPSTFELWKAATDAVQYLTVSPGYVDDVDYVAFVRHNFGSAQIPITIEGQYVPAGAWSVLVGETLLPDDAPVLFRFAPQSLNAVRAKIGDGNASAEAAVMYFGKLLVLQRRVYVGHSPFTHAAQARVTNGRSESGQFLGRTIIGEVVEGALPLQNLTPAWYRANMVPFKVAAREAPFFFAWRPQSYPGEVAYAWLKNDFAMVNQRSNGMVRTELQIGAIVS